MADLNIDSPAAAFARQAAMERRIEGVLAWALQGFLDDVEVLALRDRTYMNAGDVAASWASRMGYEALASRLPEDVARYLAEQQVGAATPDEVYDTAMAVMTSATERAWSAQLTSDVLQTALSMESPLEALTAAAPSPTSKRGQAVREAFDQALRSEGRSWGDVARRDARTAVTGLDGLRATGEMRAQGREYKQWVARHDDKTRATHVAADGQRVPVDQPFSVGGEALMYPGDRSGSAAEVINCRCVTVAADRPARGTTALPFIAPN